MSKKSKVYVETSIISYLASRPSRDYIVLARQEITREWWRSSRPIYDIFVSSLVESEAMAGDQDAAKRRLKIMQNIPGLALSKPATDLAKFLVKSGAVPAIAKEDALHIALAAVHGMDFLITWNCTHIANASIRRKIIKVIETNGYECPTICTPEELSQNPDGGPEA